MRRNVKFSLIGSAFALIVGGSAVVAQKQTGPKARYAMDVETLSGMAGMQAGRGGMGGAMSMAFGGGGKEAHMLHLRLGSSMAASGAPAADHFPPPGVKAGKTLPLRTPVRETGTGSYPMERPKGRLLLYWGCGATAGKGQPVIIDFAKVAAGQFPPGLFSVRVPRDPGPTVSNSRTYGDWPNGKDGKQPDKGSSLLGEHRVAGNYSPEIRFTLAQDYMAGLKVDTKAQPSGAVGFNWTSIPQATGYHAWAFGGMMGGDGTSQDMVWWSSAEAKEFGGGLWDWLSPGTVANLINQKIVMPPSQTSCTIPTEVKSAAKGFLMSSLVAYGPEVNFANPPKPSNPRAVWNLDWTTKVRFRAMTMWMDGMPGAANQGETPKPKCKPSLKGALKGKVC